MTHIGFVGMLSIADLTEREVATAWGNGRPNPHHEQRISVLKGGRVATHATAYRSDRVGHSGHEWDPWGHRGAYYGPMVHASP